ncbi:unnamed protein product [Merluccius merluccius]
MEDPAASRYRCLDLVFSLVGVGSFLFDWGSDVWVATEFYSRGDFFWFGVLVGWMLLASVVVQMFSWFWFRYDRDLEGFGGPRTKTRRLFGDHVTVSCLLHVLQLGFFCRHISAISRGFQVWWRGEQSSAYAVYLTHDLSMLRLIETFCESAPQLTLMTYIILHTNQARTVQCVSVAASTFSMVWMVVDYHRCLRSFLPEKAAQGWRSAAVYFLWNLLLMAPRVAAVALFASVLPRGVAAHFLLLWPALVLWAWLQGTDFMDSAGGEWLYRGTVGLIWYFSWFSVSEGRTQTRSAIYHAFMAADGLILLAAWWAYRDPVLTRSYGHALLAALPATYLTGLALKALYYYRFHPKLGRRGRGTAPPAGGGGGGVGEAPPVEMAPVEALDGGEVGFRNLPAQEGPSAPPLPPPPPPPPLCNARMYRHAAHFYSG